MKRKGIAILGSTGSIGMQALKVIYEHPDKFFVEVLTANDNVELLIVQAIKFLPNAVVIANEEHYGRLKEAMLPYEVKVYAGKDAVNQVVSMSDIDMVITAIVGYAGLLPTINAIKAGKHIALANKETMVVAGELITKLAKDNNVAIIPVDSEHSAIFQCLQGEYLDVVEKLILTASGGPFRDKNIEFLKTVKKEQALKHPSWNMGAKITIDSATLMNKGLEVIEAHWLFNVPGDRIEVVVHPQSIIHSMAQFEDGSIKAQMGLPDMKLPIQYALTYPVRIRSDFKRLDFSTYSALTFELPDTNKFRCLTLAYQALSDGGNKPCILNAANEVAVKAFLEDKIKFLDIQLIVEDALNNISYHSESCFDGYNATHNETLTFVDSLINTKYL